MPDQPIRAIQQLSEWYADQPVLRALVQLATAVPGLTALDVFLTETVEKIRAERGRTFFDELAQGEQQLTPELIQSEDFLHAYFATLNAAARTRRREKIRWFARLLMSACGDGQIDLSTEYEDYLSLLEELSYRELAILATLARFEADYPKRPEENDLQRSGRFWSEFASVAAARALVPPDELTPMLTRLNRTGAYETFVGAFLDYQGGRGKLTPIYSRLAEAIRLSEREFSKETHGGSPMS